MIDLKRMCQLMEESPLVADTDLEDDLQTWGIDPKGFHKLIDDIAMQYTKRALESRQTHEVYFLYCSAIVYGVYFGTRMAQEAEMERLAHNE